MFCLSVYLSLRYRFWTDLANHKFTVIAQQMENLQIEEAISAIHFKAFHNIIWSAEITSSADNMQMSQYRLGHDWSV